MLLRLRAFFQFVFEPLELLVLGMAEWQNDKIAVAEREAVMIAVEIVEPFEILDAEGIDCHHFHAGFITDF